MSYIDKHIAIGISWASGGSLGCSLETRKRKDSIMQAGFGFFMLFLWVYAVYRIDRSMQRRDIKLAKIEMGLLLLSIIGVAISCLVPSQN